MNREIKFRAWNEEEKKIMNPIDLSQAREHFDWLGIKDMPLMQYTGLKDKNGVEIYEGDITNFGVVGYYTDLNWDGGGSLHPGFFFDGGEMNYNDGFYNFTGTDECIEIIGNIYENPELLHA